MYFVAELPNEVITPIGRNIGIFIFKYNFQTSHHSPPPLSQAALITTSSNKANAGALSPLNAAEQLYQTGLHHLYESSQLTFLKNVYVGLLFGFAGLVSLIAAAGVPSLEESNPGLPKLLQGATFPVGLVIVYFVGAELFTGYPMWLAMTALRKKGKTL